MYICLLPYSKLHLWYHFLWVMVLPVNRFHTVPQIFWKYTNFSLFCLTMYLYLHRSARRYYHVIRLRGFSHMTSAKNGGVQTPLPPLSAKVRNWPYPPPSLVRKNQKPAYTPSPLAEIRFWSMISFLKKFFLKERYAYEN